MKRTNASKAAALALAIAAAITASPAGAQVPAKRPAAAQPPVVEAPIAITAARVITGKGATIEEATIIVRAGKIESITRDGPAPEGAQRIDGRGLTVTAGLTDALTSTGLVEIDLEGSTRDDSEGGTDPIRAAFRASDGYNPASVVIRVTRLEGVTSVGVVPGGGLISGQSAWADLDGERASDAIAAAPLAMHVRVRAGSDMEGGGHAAALLRVREAFDDARTFQKTRAAWERNQSRPFAPSRLDLEALVGTLGGKLPVVFHVDRAADILAVLTVAKELGLAPIIAGGAEAWRVRHALAAAKVPVIVYALIAGPESFDAIGARPDNAALLHGAGVAVSISTGETHNARKLRQVAGNAVRAGMPHDAAIEAITRAPAEAFGLGARYGTVEAGKVANLVVWSGDPLELSTRPVAVVIRGKRVPLESRQSALFGKYRNLPPRP